MYHIHNYSTLLFKIVNTVSFLGGIFSRVKKPSRHAVDLFVENEIELRAEHKADHTKVQPHHQHRYSGESAVDRVAVEIVDVNSYSPRERYPRYRRKNRARKLAAHPVDLSLLSGKVGDVAVNHCEHKDHIQEHNDVPEIVNQRQNERKILEVRRHHTVDRVAENDRCHRDEKPEENGELPEMPGLNVNNNNDNLMYGLEDAVNDPIFKPDENE